MKIVFISLYNKKNKLFIFKKKQNTVTISISNYKF